MMKDARPLSEITREAVRILLRETGVINTVRFLNQFTGGYGNYTETGKKCSTGLPLMRL